MLNNTIENLTDSLKPVRSLPHPVILFSVWLTVSLLYLGAVISYLGVRYDIVEQLNNSVFLFETTLAALIGLSAGICALYGCIPDKRGMTWMPGIPLSLVGVFLLWYVFKSFESAVHIPHMHWDECFTDATLLAFIPAALIITFVKTGRSTTPYVTMAMAMISVSFLGWASLRITCAIDSIGHVFFYHILPYLVLGSIIGLLARRILRW